MANTAGARLLQLIGNVSWSGESGMTSAMDSEVPQGSGAASSDIEIVARTPPLGVAISILSFGSLMALSIACLVLAGGDWSTGFRIGIILFVIILSVINIDQVQREYAFRPDSVAVRYLGVWRTRELPPKISILTFPGGDLRIMDSGEGDFCFRVRNGWTMGGKLQTRLISFYSRNGRQVERAS
jgi:hypothetical protein